MSAIEHKKDWLVRKGAWPVSIPVSKAEQALSELVDLLGRDWVNEKVKEYLIWRKNNSLETDQFVFHREPDRNPLMPYLTVALDFLSGRFSNEESPGKFKALRELGTLAGSIFYFENYWKSIPADMGRNHIISILKNAHLCRGMITELNAAIHFVQCDANCVVPCFMDPRSSEDKTDILVRWQGEEIEVHCKSKIPGAGYIVPFDVFDYWAGCFLRDAEHFRRHWYIRLEVSGEINLARAKALRQRFQHWISSKIVFEKAFVAPGIIATSQEVNIPPRGLPKNSVARLARKPRYRAFSATEGGKDGNYHSLSVFDVVTGNVPRPGRSLSNSLREIKKRLIGNRPAIALVHMFDTWDLAQLLSPRMSGFDNWLNGVLSDENGRKISALTLSCEDNRQPLTGLVGVSHSPALTTINRNAALNIPQSLFQAYQKPKEMDD